MTKDLINGLLLLGWIGFGYLSWWALTNFWVWVSGSIQESQSQSQEGPSNGKDINPPGIER